MMIIRHKVQARDILTVTATGGVIVRLSSNPYQRFLDLLAIVRVMRRLDRGRGQP